MKSIIIGICGGSAAGKTSLAVEVQKLLGGDATILSQDHYYRDIGPLSPEERLKVNFDCPDAVDETLFLEDLKRLRAGTEIRVPVYDYATCSRMGFGELEKLKDVIILEGLFLLAVERIRDLLDYTFFVDCPEETRIKRILHRDLTERGKTYEVAWANIQKYVLPMHRLYIDPFKSQADLVFLNDGSDPHAIAMAARTVLARIQDQGA